MANVSSEPLSTVISPGGEATTSNDDSLSTQRARAVASYLRDRGLKGAYSIRGDGVAGPRDAARQVNVRFTYQSGCYVIWVVAGGPGHGVEV